MIPETSEKLKFFLKISIYFFDKNFAKTNHLLGNSEKLCNKEQLAMEYVH